MSLPTLFSYLPREAAEAICKLAEPELGKKKRVIGPILAGTLGMGLGTIGGIAAGAGTNAIYKHFKGKNIPGAYLYAAAPLIGAGLGLAYNLAQAHQIEEMRRVIEDPHNKPKPGVP